MTDSFRLGLSPSTAYILGVAWVVIILVLAFGMVSVATADNAGDELENTTVELTNDTEPIVVGVEWNESIADPTTETADVTFYNASEFDDDPTTATAALEESIDADAGNVSESEFDSSAAGLDLGGEYRLIVEGTDGEVDDVWIEDSSGIGFIGGAAGQAALGGLAVIGALGVFIWLGRNE